MNIRAQVSMVFHLDKCIGCHTCSVACKNIWTDRKGTEYMWWNNVETKPGTGYPTLWEDQEKYHGGWERVDGAPDSPKPRGRFVDLQGRPITPNGDAGVAADGDGVRRGDWEKAVTEKDGKKVFRLRLKLQGRLSALGNVFYNPVLPTIDDYYEPWTYQYDELFNAPEGDDQPTARPISQITGKPMDIEAGPNWDDDLGGSPVYARNDPNLDNLSDGERQQLNELERLVFFYLPRICNHCLNPGCVAACPAGAIYKRGEDGIVLISQEKCRGWRMCISGCPYKKTYYNWATGKSEKCILCYPRLESGQAPACFHSCVGRIRYLGLVLYDADLIQPAATAPDSALVDAQRTIIQDPFDPTVIAAAKANGITDAQIEAAQKSPVYKFVKLWKIALPLHPEFRTLPMLFYVPPLLPILGKSQGTPYEIDGADREGLAAMLTTLEQARMPIRYMASLFAAGNEDAVSAVYRKLIAVRVFKRSQSVKDVSHDEVAEALAQGNTTEEEAEAIFRLTALPTFEERFVIPPMAREVAIEQTLDPYTHKPSAGFGFREAPARRF